MPLFALTPMLMVSSAIQIELGTSYHLGIFHAWFSYFQVSGYLQSCVPLLHWCINKRSHINCYPKHFQALLCPTRWHHFVALWYGATVSDVNRLLQSFTIILSISSWSFMSRLSFLHPFCSHGNKFVFSRCSYNSSAKVPVSNFQIKGRQVIGLKFDTRFSFSIFFTQCKVFPVTIHLGELFSWRHLSNWSAILVCKLIKFLIQYSCTPSGSGLFQFGIFFTCFLTF